jgi:ribosomal protein S18 acetylase RimI-like enzyme
VNFGPEEIKQAMLRGELKRFTKQDLANAMQVATQAGKQDVSEAPAGYKEIEFVCVNPQFPDATDPALQKKMYRGLKQIDGVVPLWQEWGDYSEGQASLSAIYQDSDSRDKILSLAKQLGVEVDLEQAVSADYVDRAVRGEHEGQQGMAEGKKKKSSRSTGGYFFPGYGYYGTGDSGEGGGDGGGGESIQNEDAMMGKIEDSGKIVRILKKAHTVPFSDEKNWLLIDTDPAKGNKGLGLKWVPADTRFTWVRPYRDTAEPSVTEDSLTEIENFPQDHFRGGKDSLYNYSTPGKKHLRALPGGTDLMYSITSTTVDSTNVHIVDPGIPGTTKPSIVAALSLYQGVIPDSVQVGSITVDEDYRGRGLARALYGIVLTIMKKILISGSSQTPGGRKNWLSLASIPGVEIKGLLDLADFQLDKSRQVDNTIDQLMQLGGQFVAKNNNRTYWAFDVVPGNGQLAPAVKNKLSKLYGYDSDNLLMATWTGGQQGMAEGSNHQHTEIIKHRVGDWIVYLDNHSVIRAMTRNIGPRMMSNLVTMVDMIPDLEDKVPKGGAFWIQDIKTNSSFYFKRLDIPSEPLAVRCETGVQDIPRANKQTPVFQVNAYTGPETKQAIQGMKQAKLRSKFVGTNTLANTLATNIQKGRIGGDDAIRNPATQDSKRYDTAFKQAQRMDKEVDENFADGRNPQDKGDAKRHGINTKASVSSLRKTAKQGGRKGQLAHWLANMKSGRAKKK